LYSQHRLNPFKDHDTLKFYLSKQNAEFIIYSLASFERTGLIHFKVILNEIYINISMLLKNMFYYEPWMNPLTEEWWLLYSKLIESKSNTRSLILYVQSILHTNVNGQLMYVQHSSIDHSVLHSCIVFKIHDLKFGKGKYSNHINTTCDTFTHGFHITKQMLVWINALRWGKGEGMYVRIKNRWCSDC